MPETVNNGGDIIGVVSSRKIRKNSGIGKCGPKKRPADWQMNVVS